MRIKVILIQRNNTTKNTYRALLHGTEMTCFSQTEIGALEKLVKKLKENDSKHILSNIK